MGNKADAAQPRDCGRTCRSPVRFSPTARRSGIIESVTPSGNGIRSRASNGESLKANACKRGSSRISPSGVTYTRYGIVILFLTKTGYAANTGHPLGASGYMHLYWLPTMLLLHRWRRRRNTWIRGTFFRKFIVKVPG